VTDSVDRRLVGRRNGVHREAPAGKFQGGMLAGRDVPIPAPLGAARGAHEDLVVRHHDPDHHRVIGMLFGPDRDLIQFA